MNIFYPLCLVTLFALILIIYPKLIIINKAPIKKTKVLTIYLIVVGCLYYLRNLTYFYHIALITCILSTLTLCILIYFSIHDFLLYKNSSLSKKFEFIDKMKGLEFEHYVAEILRKQGFKRVSVTKATGDFGVDITCFAKKGKEKIAIQVKRHKSPLSGKAIQEVVAGAKHYNATKTMVITNSTFTPKAKVLAKSNDCELIDRYLLRKWVHENETNSKKRATNELNSNKTPESSNLAITANPLTPSAQYMNFSDVPFTPDIDEQSSEEINTTSPNTNEDIDDLPAKPLNPNNIEAKPTDITTTSDTSGSDLNDDVSEQIEVSSENNIEIMLEEDREEVSLEEIETAEDSEISSEYNTDTTPPVETVTESFFDDL